jgi:beta-glucosidase
MNPTRLEIPLEEIRTLVGSRGEVVWAQGYSTLSDEVDSDLHSVALEAARGADIVLVFAGLPALLESEGFDRENLGLPACQLTLIDDLATVNPATVVILQNGSAVEMPFAERVPAILECYLGGQAAASALARVLFGLAEPGGRLAETFPLVAGDCPSSQHFPGNRRQVQYREGLYVGYRWFDRGRKPLLFPFGHGLSYSSFAWTDLQLSAPMIREDEKLEVRCRITNTGPRAGSEVVQLYVRDVESSFHRPDKELRAFAKVRLGGGESAELGFVLDRRAFTFWDRTSGDWRVEGGEFRILVASSARETRLEGRVRIESASPALPLEDPALAVWRSPDRGANLGGANFSGADLDDAAFAALLGRPIPPMPIVRGFGLDSTIEELRSKLLGRIFHGLVRRGMRAQSEENHDEVVAKMEERMLAEMPLSSLVRLGGGKFTFPMAKALVDLLNGHPLRAIGSFLRRS